MSKSIMTFWVSSCVYFTAMMAYGVSYNLWPYPLLALLSMPQRLTLGLGAISAGSLLSYLFTKFDQSKNTKLS